MCGIRKKVPKPKQKQECRLCNAHGHDGVEKKGHKKTCKYELKNCQKKDCEICQLIFKSRELGRKNISNRRKNPAVKKLTVKALKSKQRCALCYAHGITDVLKVGHKKDCPYEFGKCPMKDCEACKFTTESRDSTKNDISNRRKAQKTKSRNAETNSIEITIPDSLQVHSKEPKTITSLDAINSDDFLSLEGLCGTKKLNSIEHLIFKLHF